MNIVPSIAEFYVIECFSNILVLFKLIILIKNYLSPTFLVLTLLKYAKINQTFFFCLIYLSENYAICSLRDKNTRNRRSRQPIQLQSENYNQIKSIKFSHILFLSLVSLITKTEI